MKQEAPKALACFTGEDSYLPIVKKDLHLEAVINFDKFTDLADFLNRGYYV